MAEARDLPGWPKKKLVKLVRAHLWRYGIRPQGETWWATWSWASAVARSYYYTNWPTPHEIGSQYLLLLLAQMHANHALKLPYRAHQVIPPEALLAADRPDSPPYCWGGSEAEGAGSTPP